MLSFLHTGLGTPFPLEPLGGRPPHKTLQSTFKRPGRGLGRDDATSASNPSEPREQMTSRTHFWYFPVRSVGASSRRTKPGFFSAQRISSFGQRSEEFHFFCARFEILFRWSVCAFPAGAFFFAFEGHGDEPNRFLRTVLLQVLRDSAKG